MTAPVCNLSININDDGTAVLHAADWSKEGHTWAIEARPITIAQLRAVASALGRDAVEGVQARLEGNRERLAAKVALMKVRLADVEDAKRALDKLDKEMLGGWPT